MAIITEDYCSMEIYRLLILNNYGKRINKKFS